MTELLPCEAAGRTHRGGRSGPNEDYFKIERAAGWLAAFVADGMGGRPGGRAAARIGVRAAAVAFHHLASESADPGAPECDRVARECGEAAQEAVLLERARTPALERMASTLVGLVTDGRHAAVVSLGDSRAYLARGRAAAQITTDHAAVLDGEWVVTRYLGSATAEPDIRTVDVRAGDRFALCTDGVFGDLARPERDISTAARAGDAASVARRLVRGAIRRRAADNATAVVVTFGAAAEPTPLSPVLRALGARVARLFRISATP